MIQFIILKTKVVTLPEFLTGLDKVKDKMGVSYFVRHKSVIVWKAPTTGKRGVRKILPIHNVRDDKLVRFSIAMEQHFKDIKTMNKPPLVLFKACPSNMEHAMVNGEVVGAIFPMHCLKHCRDEPWNVVLYKVATFHKTEQLAKDHISSVVKAKIECENLTRNSLAAMIY